MLTGEGKALGNGGRNTIGHVRRNPILFGHVNGNSFSKLAGSRFALPRQRCSRGQYKRNAPLHNSVTAPDVCTSRGQRGECHCQRPVHSSMDAPLHLMTSLFYWGISIHSNVAERSQLAPLIRRHRTSSISFHPLKNKLKDNPNLNALAPFAILLLAGKRTQKMPVIHDRYRVIQELSTTLYGWVFTCEDMRGSATAIAPVVIKQVSLERMANFMEEYPMEGHTPDNPIIEKEVGDIIRAAGGHPNLVQYTDSFVEKQSLYLVMEYCADGDMYDYLSKRRQRNMSCLNALSVLSQVAAGLAFLHQHNIAHRDISLENIMLHRGRCKLGDFGLATRAGRGGGRQVGKDYYMAPEIVAGEPYDPKAADIWSLGIVFFIMLTGSPLVSQASMSVKSFRALKQAGISTVLEAWGVADSMPLSAQHLVAGMLEIDPLKRLTIEQVIEHDAFNECLG